MQISRLMRSNPTDVQFTNQQKKAPQNANKSLRGVLLIIICARALWQFCERKLCNVILPTAARPNVSSTANYNLCL